MIKRVVSTLLLLLMLASCTNSKQPEVTTNGDIAPNDDITTAPIAEEDKEEGKMFTEYFEGNALYTEKWRPYYHFTTKNSWINDPNGLVCHNGTYHIYYQNNPNSNLNGNIHWGHATSTDIARPWM